MSKQSSQIAVFFVLALLSYALYNYYFNTEEILTDKPFTKGYSIEDIELKITDNKGKLTAKFKAPSIIRYTDSPIMFIDQPVFWTYANGKEHWSIASKNAEYNDVKDEVVLKDNLLAKTVDKSSAVSFKANNLLINLKTHLAYTKDGISFQQDQFSMVGQIAHFDLNNETLEVNNNVKAIYKSNKN